MRQEFKVGLALIATVIVLVLGVRFFEDVPLFGGTNLHTTSLTNADGLAAGNAVVVSGVTVGKVSRVALDPRTQRVVVEYTVETSARLTQGTVASLTGIPALGGVRLELVPGTPENALLRDGEAIPASSAPDVLGDLQARAPLLAARLDTLLLGAGLTVGETYSLVSDPDSDLRIALAQLRQTTALLNELVRRQQAPLDATFASAERTLASAQRTLAGVERATAGLPGTIAGFDATSAEARALIGDLRGVTYENRDTVALAVARLNASMLRLQQTMARVDTTSRRADALLARVERGEGNLGMLLNDSTLYIRLDTTLNKTNGLLEDFRRNPARYLRHLKLVDIF